MSPGEECELDVKYRILRDHPIGREMPQDRLELCAYLSKRVKYLDSEHIFRQGELGERAFILVEGVVDVLRETRGKTRTLMRLTPGDSFGELSLVVAKPRPYSARAAGPATLLMLDRTGFRKVLDKFPEAALGIIEKIAARDADLMNLLLAHAVECEEAAP